MKKSYEIPEINVTKFSIEDVITVSIGDDQTREIGVLYANLA